MASLVVRAREAKNAHSSYVRRSEVLAFLGLSTFAFRSPQAPLAKCLSCTIGIHSNNFGLSQIQTRAKSKSNTITVYTTHNSTTFLRQEQKQKTTMTKSAVDFLPHSSIVANDVTLVKEGSTLDKIKSIPYVFVDLTLMQLVRVLDSTDQGDSAKNAAIH